MAYRSGLFNSVNGDRKYQAAHFAEYFATFIGNGVFPNPSNGLQVYAKENMTVTVKPGKAWINGYYFVNDSDCDLTLDIADGVLNRIDRIVLRFDTATRQVIPMIRKGSFSTISAPPTIQRDADGYEISLAQISIKKGTVAISQGMILDERLNTEVCGIVHGTVDQVDTTTLFNQYKAWLDSHISLYEDDLLVWTKAKKAEYEYWKTERENIFDTWHAQEKQEFDDWFSKIQFVLDGDTAGHLFNLIETNRVNIEQIQQDMKVDFDNIGSVLTSHVQKTASDTKLGHVKSDGETTVINNGVISAKMTDSVTGEKWAWKMENGLAFIEKEVI